MKLYKTYNKQESFKCLKCGYEDNAALNASKNFLVAGHVMLACESGIFANEIVSHPEVRFRNHLPLGGRGCQ